LYNAITIFALIVLNIFYHLHHLHHFYITLRNIFFHSDAAVERQKLEIKIQYSSPRPQLNQGIYPFPNATEGQLQTFIIQMIVIKKKELLFGIPRMYPQIVCILPGIGRLGTKWMMQ